MGVGAYPRGALLWPACLLSPVWPCPWGSSQQVLWQDLSPTASARDPQEVQEWGSQRQSRTRWALTAATSDAGADALDHAAPSRVGDEDVLGRCAGKRGAARPSSVTASFLPRPGRRGTCLPSLVSMRHTTDDLSPGSGHVRDVALGACPAGVSSPAVRLCHAVTPDTASSGFPRAATSPPQDQDPRGGGRGHLHLLQRLPGGRVASVTKTWEAERRKLPPTLLRPPPAPTLAERVGETAEAKKARQHFPSTFLRPSSHLANVPEVLPGPSPRPCSPEINP